MSSLSLSLSLLLACAASTSSPESAVGAAAAQPRPYEVVIDGRAAVAGIAYGPHREGQRPGGIEPSSAEIHEDLQLIGQHWSVLRTYGSRGATPRILATIRQHELPLKVVVGAWIDADDPAANRAEVDMAIELARTYPEQVVALSIGNETQVSWAAHRSPVEPLIEHLRRARAAVSQPVSTADDYSYWLLPESRALATELDFLMVHAHPLWNGQQLDAGLSWTASTLDAVRAVHPDQTLVLAEIGWATSHDPAAAEGEHIRGSTGEAEQATFYRDFSAWAEDQQLPYFWFEAFDESWKGGDSPAEVEKNWGLYHADRSPKTALSGASDVP